MAPFQAAKKAPCISTGSLILIFIVVLWVCSFGYFISHGSIKPATPASTPSPAPTLPTPASLPKQSTNSKPADNWEGNDNNIHIVFSTDCSFFQDWQSLLVFNSAQQVHQPGQITRIASGCKEDKQAELVELYRLLYPMYHVHFTPDFKTDNKTQKRYDFYNKPYGLHHWLKFANPPVKEHTVVALIDPDMIILRPITLKIAGNPTNLYLDDFNPATDYIPKFVGRGQPAAAIYGLGAPWATNSKNFDRLDVCGAGSPCLEVSRRDGERSYSVGPPYLVEKDDLLRLTNSWTKFVPKVYTRYPELLAEMYAYAMAAAHQKLPHFTMRHYMVSNTDMSEEGWAFVDKLGEDVCTPPSQPGVYYPDALLPNILHFCQFYRVGEMGFQKRRLRKKMLTCDGPLLASTPTDLAKLRYKNRDGDIIKLGPQQAKRNAFMLCTLHRSINDMLMYYRLKTCPDHSKINRNQTESLIAKGY